MTLVQTDSSRKGAIYVFGLAYLQFRLRFFRVIRQCLFAFMWARFSRLFGTGAPTSARFLAHSIRLSCALNLEDSSEVLNGMAMLIDPNI